MTTDTPMRASGIRADYALQVVCNISLFCLFPLVQLDTATMQRTFTKRTVNNLFSHEQGG